MRTFATEPEFLAFVASELVPQSTPDAVRAALVEGLGEAEAQCRAEPRPARGETLDLRVNSWILREQDIPVAEMIGIVGAALTAALAPGALVAGAVATAVASFAALCWKAWRKGATLSKTEVAVLGFLQMNGPMSLDELAARAAAALDLAPKDVRGAVRSLQDVELRDGDIVELIRKDAAGQWRTRPL